MPHSDPNKFGTVCGDAIQWVKFLRTCETLAIRYATPVFALLSALCLTTPKRLQHGFSYELSLLCQRTLAPSRPNAAMSVRVIKL